MLKLRPIKGTVWFQQECFRLAALLTLCSADTPSLFSVCAEVRRWQTADAKNRMCSLSCFWTSLLVLLTDDTGFLYSWGDFLCHLDDRCQLFSLVVVGEEDGKSFLAFQMEGEVICSLTTAAVSCWSAAGFSKALSLLVANKNYYNILESPAFDLNRVKCAL